jgi:CRISPR-associated protein Cas1
MGTVYVTQPDAFIGKTDERLSVKANKQTILDVPLIKVDGVVVLERATISPAAVSEFLERHIPLSFIKLTGKYLGRLEPEMTKNIFVRKAQWLEGAGSAAYFGSFNQLIKGSEFQFEVRRRRPPTDPVNALLSFAYSLLRHDVQGAVNIVGFDPYLGYLHVERYGRPSLALDVMEEFRPLVADAVVLSILNKRLLKPSDFTSEPLSEAVSLTKEGLHTFLRLYEQKKQSVFKHPVLGRKCTYQEAFEIQARLLAKYLMGEIDKYPPLVLK